MGELRGGERRSASRGIDSRKRAVVFGAGPVGTTASERLVEKGVAVRLATRSGRLPERLRGKVDSEVVDALDRDAVLRATEGADFIVHCLNVSYELWHTILPPVQHNLIAAAVKNRAVFAAAENLYLYGAPDAPITESSPIDPPTRKGRLRAELHRMLHEAQAEHALRWVTVRASDYYGPGATMQSHFGFRFLDPLFRGKRPRLFGDPDQLHSVVYVDDYGQAIADAALDPTAHNRTWIAPHDRPITRRELAQVFFRSAGKQGDVGQIPNALIAIAGMFVPFLRELPEMRYQFDRPFTVDDTAFRTHFHTEAVSLAEGVQRTVEWYRSLGRSR